jgi:hypothetical protein
MSFYLSCFTVQQVRPAGRTTKKAPPVKVALES